MTARTEPVEAARIVALGDAALAIEFGDRIDPAINARAIAAAEAIAAAALPGVRDIVPTFKSVAVYFDPLTVEHGLLAQTLRRIAERPFRGAAPSPEPIRVPVCYGGADGPDLVAVAAFARLPMEAVIERHCAATYRVFMLGFMPGFPYMGLVDEAIAAPRRHTPRTSVPAGSVGIAARQTGIYPLDSPGGWQLIGRTPLRIFDARRTRASLFQAGDMVRFFPITRDQWDRYA